MTASGGHFLNRRWDLAVLFFVLLLIAAVVTSSLGTMLYASDSPQILVAIPILLVCFTSAIVTFFTGRAEEQGAPSGLAAGIAATGLTLTSILAVVWSLGIAVIFMAMNSDGAVEFFEDGDVGGFSFGIPSVQEYKYFGSHDQSAILPEPPVGDHWITGQVTYQGEPAAGVEVQIALNDAYRTPVLVTAEDGTFRIPIPEGSWSLNFIEIADWPDAPRSSDLQLMTEHEPGFTEDTYSMFGAASVTLEASPDPEVIQLPLRLVDAMIVSWPAGTEFRGEPVESGPADVITWEPVEGATQYRVDIDEVTREGTGWRQESRANIEVTGRTSLPLAELTTVPDADGANEYSVELAAYDSQGKLLTTTGFANHHFTLQAEIVNEDFMVGLDDIGDDSEMQVYLQRMENRDRTDAAQVLIENDMLEEAEQLLNRLTDADTNGEFERLQGYIAAKRGQCGLAVELFRNATLKTGRNCTPEWFYEACPGAVE